MSRKPPPRSPDKAEEKERTPEDLNERFESLARGLFGVPHDQVKDLEAKLKKR
jgi:hypothetical protein